LGTRGLRVILRAILILAWFVSFSAAAMAEDKCDALRAAGAHPEVLVKAGCVKPGKDAPKTDGAPDPKPALSAAAAVSAPASTPVSLFERYLSASSPAEPAVTLKPFGYDLFTGPTLNPSADLPVSNDYIIGPGDEVSVLLWGRINGEHSLTVTREGTVLFPNIGPLSVAGMTFEEMKRYLTRQSANIIGTDISVTAGRLRSIQVFVLGEVRKPGAYSLSAMSTITNALMASGVSKPPALTSCNSSMVGETRDGQISRSQGMRMGSSSLVAKASHSRTSPTLFTNQRPRSSPSLGGSPAIDSCLIAALAPNSYHPSRSNPYGRSASTMRGSCNMLLVAAQKSSVTEPRSVFKASRPTSGKPRGASIWCPISWTTLKRPADVTG